MATPFQEVYDTFLSQITDYELAVMEETSLDENMEKWMKNAIGYFSNCRHNLLDYDDDVAKQFNDDLTNNELYILSKFMVFVYLDTHLIKEDLMKQSLNSKDYRMYSPANQIKAIQGLKESVNAEANILLSRYSYNIHTLKDYFK